jgi:hypothetical protein
MSTKLTDVKAFDGKLDRLEIFVMQIIGVMEIEDKKLDTNWKKIAYILGKFTDIAAQWGLNWMKGKRDKAAKNKTTPDYRMFQDFLETVGKTFSNPIEKEKAHQSLKMYKQGGLPMHTFLAQFKNLARKAKYFGEDNYLISLLKPACNGHLVTLIALRENPPTTFKAWKEALIKSDGIRKEVWEATGTGYQPPPFRPRETALFQQFPRPPPQARQFFGPNFFRNPQQNNLGLQSSAHPTQGAVTFRGQGQPMIMDKAGQRKCFNCGRLGYISWDCRAPRNNPQNHFTLLQTFYFYSFSLSHRMVI